MGRNTQQHQKYSPEQSGNFTMNLMKMAAQPHYILAKETRFCLSASFFKSTFKARLFPDDPDWGVCVMSGLYPLGPRRLWHLCIL